MVNSWKELTLREKIGQTVVILGDPEEEIRQHGSLEAFLDKYPVGGVFVGGEIIKDATEGYDNVRAATKAYRKASRTPMLFASDMENGCGSMVKGLTPFPYLMSLGAAGSEQLAYDYGKGTALESKFVGVNWTFSPVSDLNLNRLNPITNIRAVSDQADLTQRLLKQVVRGMQEHGLAAGAKHFPGDGVDYRDQHLITTMNSLSREEWLEQHGAVFKALIDDGLYSIMTGHICLPAFQTPTEDGRYLPSTLSYELTTELLKAQLGFKGVVVSDALIMGGYLGWYERTQADIECLKAGTDMLLWPTMDYFDRMETAIASGEVSIERLDDAVERVWEMKRKLGVLDEQPKDYIELDNRSRQAVRDTAREVAEKSITLLRDKGGKLPLNKNAINKALVVGIVQHDPLYEDMKAVQEELAAYGIETDMRRNISFTRLAETEGEYDLIIYALASRPHMPMGPLNFTKAEADSIWASLSTAKEKSIVISFGSPYFYNEYFEAAPVYLNAYSPIDASFRAAVRALLGEIPCAGQSPVKLRL